jgi:general secretion pathway protein N
VSLRAGLGLGVLTLVAYLVFLVATFPAAVVARWAPPQLGIDPGAVRGTVWSGALEGLAVGDSRLGPIRWEGRPWRLLLGEAVYDLDVEGKGLKAVGRLGWSLTGGTLSLRDLGLRLDAAVLRDLGVVPVQLEGTGEGRVTRLDWRPGGLPLVEGELNWQGAILHLPARLDLGTVELRATTDDGSSEITWDGQPGSVDVGGSLTLTPPVDYRVRLRVKPVAELDSSAERVLGMLGRPAPDGAYTLNFSGQIKPPSGSAGASDG